MRCTHCNVEIADSTDICPLCHNLLRGDVPAREEFPKKRNARLYAPSFEKLYVYIAFHVLAVCVLLNFLIFDNTPWCIYVAGTLVAMFLLTKFAIAATGKLHFVKDKAAPKNTTVSFAKRFFHI